MALESTYTIIWLDTHISSKNNCPKMKTEFAVGLVRAAAVPSPPPGSIDDLVCTMHVYSTPIEFAATQDRALELIETNLGLKKVIFISSASLSRKIIPEIKVKELQIESYYVFCAFGK